MLQPRAGDHLPLRTFEDRELDSAPVRRQADPLLGILGALADLPNGWRALAQVWSYWGRLRVDWARDTSVLRSSGHWTRSGA